jgi:hypothetical protein
LELGSDLVDMSFVSFISLDLTSPQSTHSNGWTDVMLPTILLSWH